MHKTCTRKFGRDGFSVAGYDAGIAGKAFSNTEMSLNEESDSKLGCVFTQTKWDGEGYPIRDPDSTTFTGAIETAEEFGKRLYLEAWDRRVPQPLWCTLENSPTRQRAWDLVV
jgi:hypothetical protein